ncbi:MAG: type II toxin-antitoxin system HicB family antitoxin [Desulfotignum sp.]|nr:type II toxin-antitoxin system HicB family antitoxin [Desulfotignum sp.]
MQDYHINIFYSDDDEGYIADIPDLEACSAFGETPDEALHEVQKAKDLWIKAARARGQACSAPKISTGYISGGFLITSADRAAMHRLMSMQPEQPARFDPGNDC